MAKKTQPGKATRKVRSKGAKNPSSKKPSKGSSKSASRKKTAARPVPPRWRERTDEDWDRWGQRLGSRIERRFEDFGKDMEHHGTRTEKRGKDFEKRAKSWWYRTFGPIGPFLQALIGVIFLGIAVFALGIVNAVLTSGFVSGVGAFIMENIGLLFAIMLFFNYIKYVYVSAPSIRWAVKPLEVSSGITVTLWLLGVGLGLAYNSSGIESLGGISAWLLSSLWAIFFAVLAISYIIMIVVWCACSPRKGC